MRIKTLFTIFAAIAALSASAQTGSEPQAGDIVRQGNSIYYLVRVFATPEQNAAFQRDIDIMRRHATAIDKCKLRIKEITDAEKTFEKDPKKLEALAADKARISSALDKLVKDFSTNEEAMKSSTASFPTGITASPMMNPTFACPLRRRSFPN